MGHTSSGRNSATVLRQLAGEGLGLPPAGDAINIERDAAAFAARGSVIDDPRRNALVPAGADPGDTFGGSSSAMATPNNLGKWPSADRGCRSNDLVPEPNSSLVT